MPASASSANGRIVLPVVVFLALHLLLRLLGSPSLHRDDAELLLFNQGLAWGYSEQPPLYSWLYFALSQLLGESLFSLTLLRVLLAGGTAGFMYLAAREMFADRTLAILAAYSLLAVPMLAWHALTYLTHSLLLCCLCAATLYVAVRLGKYARTRDYLLLGLCAGLGGLSKYNYAIFLVCLAAAGLTLRPLRQRLLDRRLWLAVAVAGLLVLPHALWLWEHGAALTASYRHKTTAAGAPALGGPLPWGVVELAQGLVLLSVPTLAIFALTLPRALRFDRKSPPGQVSVWSSWLGRFFVALALAHLLLVLATGADRLHERWLEPFFLFLPLWLLARIHNTSPAEAAQLLRPTTTMQRYVAYLVMAALVLTVARGAQIGLGGAHRGYNSIDSSYTELAALLRAETAPGALIVAEDTGLAGNLRLHVPELACVAVHSPFYVAPARARGRTCVLIWDEAGSQTVPPWVEDQACRWTGRDLPVDLTVQRIELSPLAVGRPAKTVRYAVVKLNP